MMNKKSDRGNVARHKTAGGSRAGSGFGISSVAAWLLLLAAPALAVHFVYSYGANVPWWDEWDGILPLFEKYDAGALRFMDLWTLHNEHRILIQRLLMLGIGLLTNYNGVVFMYCVLACLGLLAWTFIHVFRTQFAFANPLWLAPFALLAFSIRQSGNMIWAFQIGFVLAAVLPILSFLSLHSMKNGRECRKFATAAVLAGIASFSSAQGLLAWPVGVLLLLPAPLEKRKRVILIGVWMLLAAAAWFTYFLGYARPEHHPGFQVSFEYLSVIMGASLFDSLTEAKMAGIFLFALLAVTLVRLLLARSLVQNAFWLSVIAFSILVQLSIMVGRASMGADQALATRYPTFSLLTVAGLYALLAGLALRNRSRWDALLVTLLLLAMAASAPAALKAAVFEGKAAKSERELYALVIKTVESPPPELVMLFYRSDIVLKRAAAMKKQNLAFFANDELVNKCLPPSAMPPTLPVSTRFSVHDPSWFPKKGVLVLSGWAVDSRNDAPAGNVYLQLDGKFYPVYYGLARMDTEETLKNPQMVFSGFLSCIPLGKSAAGQHSGKLWILTRDQDAVFSGGEFNFELK